MCYPFEWNPFVESVNVFAPTISAKTINVQVGLNENVAIPCVAQGFPIPAIRWVIHSVMCVVRTCHPLLREVCSVDRSIKRIEKASQPKSKSLWCRWALSDPSFQLAPKMSILNFQKEKKREKKEYHQTNKLVVQIWRPSVVVLWLLHFSRLALEPIDW